MSVIIFRMRTDLQNDKVFVGIINTNDAGVDLADDEILNDLDVIALPSAAQDVESPASYSRNISEQALFNKETQLGVDDLKRCIINNNGEYLIKKYNENSSLSDPHRKAIVAIIVKKLTTEHTFWPTTKQKIQYAKLAVELLPIYKTTNELFYDPAKQRGFINSRLKTVQKHIRETTGERKQKLKTGKSSIESSDVNIPQSFSIETLKEQFKDDIEFLSNCPTTETSAILERMKKNFFMRKSILSSEKISALWDIFPCYLTSPEILIQDYFIRTGCAGTNSEAIKFINPIFEKYAALKFNKNKQGIGTHLQMDVNVVKTTTIVPEKSKQKAESHRSSNQSANREFLSYAAFSRHMLSCINNIQCTTELNELTNIFPNSTLDDNIFNISTSVQPTYNIPTESTNISSIILNHNRSNINDSNEQFVQPNLSLTKSIEDSLLSNIVNLKLPESVTNVIFSRFTSYINSKSHELLKFVLTTNLSKPQEYKYLVDKIKNQKNPFSGVSTTYLRNRKLESG
ncbi:hypothetical protein Bhyg_13619, partial [Pseudolycoriella hygida]